MVSIMESRTIVYVIQWWWIEKKLELGDRVVGSFDIGRPKQSSVFVSILGWWLHLTRARNWFWVWTRQRLLRRANWRWHWLRDYCLLMEDNIIRLFLCDSFVIYKAFPSADNSCQCIQSISWLGQASSKTSNSTTIPPPATTTITRVDAKQVNTGIYPLTMVQWCMMSICNQI